MDLRCRTCLNSNPNLEFYNLFSDNEPVAYFGFTSTVDLLKTHGDIEISNSDQYPKVICSTCLDELKRSVTFRARCKTSELTIKNAHFEDLEDFKSEIDSGDTEMMTKHQIKMCNVGDYENQSQALRCDICSTVCDSRSRLERHYRVHTKERPYKCNFCSQTFARKDTLEGHMLAHTDLRQYQCTICSKVYKRKDTLYKHCKSVHDVTPDTNKAEYRKLLRKYEADEIEYECKTCSKKFGTKLGLTQHRIVHTMDRKFKCEKCNKTFAWKKSYTTHITTTHSQAREFKCEKCPSSFKQAPHLLKHTRTVHNESETNADARPFVCKLCPSRFQQRAHLTKHMILHKNREEGETEEEDIEEEEIEEEESEEEESKDEESTKDYLI